MHSGHDTRCQCGKKQIRNALSLGKGVGGGSDRLMLCSGGSSFWDAGGVVSCTHFLLFSPFSVTAVLSPLIVD